MRGGSTVSHGRDLVAVCIEKLLQRFLGAHMVPISIELSGKIVEVAKMSHLLATELWVLG